MKLNGAAILIECLIEQGVGTVFGFPGGAVLPIYDELYKRQDRIHHVLTAHEQHAGHAADGYARASGKTGVCIATSGPGATNLVTPIATAYMDSTPIVFITGNVPQSLMGTDSFQEADISGMTMPVTKHNYLVTRVDKLAEAFYIASSGRPGPVLIDIPKDVQIAETEYEPASGAQLIPKLSMKHPTAQLRPEGEALERYKVKAAPRLEQAAADLLRRRRDPLRRGKRTAGFCRPGGCARGFHADGAGRGAGGQSAYAGHAGHARHARGEHRHAALRPVDCRRRAFL